MTQASDNPPPHIRLAETADVDSLVQLVESAYRGEVSRAGWTTEADLLDGQRIDAAGVTECIDKPDSCVMLAEDARGLIACCQLERQQQSCYFGMFAVSPQLQGAGIGRRLLTEAEQFARTRWQCSEMQMTVIEQRDSLIEWYLRRGYHRTGQYRPFPYGDARFGVPKRDDLRFELLLKLL